MFWTLLQTNCRIEALQIYIQVNMSIRSYSGLVGTLLWSGFQCFFKRKCGVLVSKEPSCVAALHLCNKQCFCKVLLISWWCQILKAIWICLMDFCQVYYAKCFKSDLRNGWEPGKAVQVGSLLGLSDCFLKTDRALALQRCWHFGRHSATFHSGPVCASSETPSRASVGSLLWFMSPFGGIVSRVSKDVLAKGRGTDTKCLQGSPGLREGSHSSRNGGSRKDHWGGYHGSFLFFRCSFTMLYCTWCFLNRIAGHVMYIYIYTKIIINMYHIELLGLMWN
jgi:hypothetical protein